jgi:hypothetical protein
MCDCGCPVSLTMTCSTNRFTLWTINARPWGSQHTASSTPSNLAFSSMSCTFQGKGDWTPPREIEWPLSSQSDESSCPLPTVQSLLNSVAADIGVSAAFFECLDDVIVNTFDEFVTKKVCKLNYKKPRWRLVLWQVRGNSSKWSEVRLVESHAPWYETDNRAELTVWSTDTPNLEHSKIGS